MDVCRSFTRKNTNVNTAQMHTLRSGDKAKFMEVTISNYMTSFKVGFGDGTNTPYG